MTVDDEDKAQQEPSQPPRVPSPTPPPPDMSLFDEATDSFNDPLEALASIITPPPRPVEEEELRPEDAIEPTPEPPALRPSQPELSRAAFGSQPDQPRRASRSSPNPAQPAFGSQPDLSRPTFGSQRARASQPDRTSQPDRDSIPDADGTGADSSRAAAIAPDAVASRRARARITLRIPDDHIPGSTSPQPPTVEPATDDRDAAPVAMVHAMRIIAIGEPVKAAALPEVEEPRTRLPSDVDMMPLGEGDVQSAWTPAGAPGAGEARAETEDDEEVEPEPEDEDAPATTPGSLVVPTPLPPPAVPRPRMASVPPTDAPGPSGPGVVAFGPLPPVEAPRPRIASVPPTDTPTPRAPAAAYGPLPPVEAPRPRMPSVPPVDLPTPSPTAVATFGPLPPVEPPRPRMASMPPVDAPTPSAPPVVEAPTETVELDDADVAPDSLQRVEREPATVRAPDADVAPAFVPPPPPKLKPTPSLPQTAPVLVSPEDVMAAVSPAPAPVRAVSLSPPPVSVEEVVPEPAEELEAEEVVPEPAPRAPAPPPKPLASEPRPVQHRPAEDGVPRRRVRPPWEEVFSDDFVRAFPRLTPRQVSSEVTFVEESLGVQKGGVVLDLACGAGQHAVELASRGYNVVGYDLSLTMLALAADEAQERGQKINFLQGDMREMAFEEMFDAVYSWSTSFGFFDEDKNASVLRRIRRALRQSGMFLLDVVNRDYIVSRLPTLNWFEGDGCVCIDDAQFDSITSRLRVKRTLMREDGKSREVEYSVRLYALHEIGKLLHEAGFKVVEVSGQPATAGAYFGADSPRMIILAERR